MTKISTLANASWSSVILVTIVPMLSCLITFLPPLKYSFLVLLRLSGTISWNKGGQPFVVFKFFEIDKEDQNKVLEANVLYIGLICPAIDVGPLFCCTKKQKPFSNFSNLLGSLLVHQTKDVFIYFLESGDLFMFGENENGKLGIPTSDNHYRPTKVDTPGPLKTISCGGNHSVGIDPEGNAIVFGSNQMGEVGLPRHIQWATQPLKLAPELFKGEKIKMVSCGENHTAFITGKAT